MQLEGQLHKSIRGLRSIRGSLEAGSYVGNKKRRLRSHRSGETCIHNRDSGDRWEQALEGVALERGDGT